MSRAGAACMHAQRFFLPLLWIEHLAEAQYTIIYEALQCSGTVSKRGRK